MQTEALFAERWKELESATRIAFPTWDGKEVEKFLKKMHVEGIDFTRLMALRYVRNALTHNPLLNGNPIVAVNGGVVQFLDEVIERLKKLPMVSNIWIPRSEVYFGSLDDAISTVVGDMLTNVYSHVPVLDSDDKVLGVFSESTMLEMNKAGIRDDGTTTLKAVAEFLPCNRHTAEVFRFVPKNDSVAHIRHLCAEALQKHERIGMFFVTENGKSDEPLLGILTVWDIAGVSDINEPEKQLTIENEPNTIDYDAIHMVIPHAVTIYVDDVYKWLEVVVKIETVSRDKLLYSGQEVLGPKWIYRGQANSDWEIRSSFERNILPYVPKDAENVEDTLRERERASILHFRQWVEMPKEQMPTVRGEWLALMQHHGVPTRLVDFTESPLTALGFAVEDATQNNKDFAIWAALGSSSCGESENRKLMECLIRGDRKVELLDTLVSRIEKDEDDRAAINRILDDGKYQCEPRLVRYVPLSMNDRQKRQRGLFLASTHLNMRFMPLLHKWTNTAPGDLQDANLKMKVDDVMTPDGTFRDDIANAHIIKFVFDKRLRDTVASLLRSCNITYWSRYGGIDKLAEEAKEMLKVGVWSAP